MSRTFITLFFILAISTVAVLSQTTGNPELCGENAMWSECHGDCSPTCDVPNPLCPSICRGGCICKPGYRENKNGLCIPAVCCKWEDESSE